MRQEQLFDAGPIVIKRRQGRPVTKCRCGACPICANRAYMRQYMRDRTSGARRTRRPPAIWTPERERLLGLGPDRIVAIVLNFSYTSVHRRRRELGIPIFRDKRTKNSEPTKRVRLREGYCQVKVSADDPLAAMARSGGYVLEHRLVMARHLGRPLAKDEFVHHRNGRRDDNRIENLELWSRSHPDGQRVEDLFAWAVEFVERYADLVGSFYARRAA